MRSPSNGDSAGLIAAPFAVLPHELGHYVVLLVLGVPGLALHYSTVTWDLEEFWGAVQRADFGAAEAVAPIRGVVLSDAVGPLITYANRRRLLLRLRQVAPTPGSGRSGLPGAGTRIAVGVVHMVREGVRHVQTDQLRRAARLDTLTGIPVEVFVTFGLVVLCLILRRLAGALFSPPARASSR